MLSRVNSLVWLPDGEEDGSYASWNTTTAAAGGGGGVAGVDSNIRDVASLSNFKPVILDVDNEGYYLQQPSTSSSSPTHIHQPQPHTTDIRDIDISFPPTLTEPGCFLFHHHHHPIDSSSSCTPSPSLFTHLDPHPSQVHYLLSPPSKPTISPLLGVLPNNTFDCSFDLVCGQGIFHETHVPNLASWGAGVLGGFSDLCSQDQMTGTFLGPDSQLSAAHLVQMAESNAVADLGALRFRGFDKDLGNPVLLNRSKFLKPLENYASVGAHLTLESHGSDHSDSECDDGVDPSLGGFMEGGGAKFNSGEENEKPRKKGSGDGFLENISLDGSALNCDSDEFTGIRKVEESADIEGTNSNTHYNVTGAGGDTKGKKKVLPAKNLMAERRRRKKLNDRLYMLRSVVPKISKMDRASILGDAVDYLKELLQKINDLHAELESTPPTSSTAQATSFYPLSPSLPLRVKEEVCRSSLPSRNGQPARIEVRLRGGAVNIHMFCARKPGLLLSIMKSLDSLGLDIQQAVISCFNGFAMDIFRAEVRVQILYRQALSILPTLLFILWELFLPVRIHNFQQCKEGPDHVHPDQIKAILMESAGSHGCGPTRPY